MQSKVFIYVVLIIGVGLAINHFTKSENLDETIVEESEITEKKGWKRAEFTMLNLSPKRISDKVLLVEEGAAIHRVIVSEIMYCEKVGNIVKIVGKEKNVNTTYTLTKLKEKIKDPFFIYDDLNSFIINFDFVEQYQPKRMDINKNTYKHYIIMSDDEEIPLPKSKVGKFKNEWINYIKNY